MIISFFIPHSGCPHQCVFCNQKKITGENLQPDGASINLKINDYLKSSDKKENVQTAFYGGSFTALPLETQRTYLETVRPFMQSGQIQGIRLSTRPDCISKKILLLLREYHVKTVELGAQAMDDDVLRLSGRGHAAFDTVNAVHLLREYDFNVGLQLMPGLPGDSTTGFIEKTVEKVIELKPDFVRLYPLLVIKDTPLEELYKTGRYIPLSLDDAVALCREAMVRFEQAGIDVIRVGLQPSEELEKPGTILGGPYHPAFRQLVESSLLLDKMRAVLINRKNENDTAVILVNPHDVSAAIGQRRSNIYALMKEFKLKRVRILSDPNASRRSARADIADMKLLDSAESLC